jgi:hypothetical protein
METETKSYAVGEKVWLKHPHCKTVEIIASKSVEAPPEVDWVAIYYVCRPGRGGCSGSAFDGNMFRVRPADIAGRVTGVSAWEFKIKIAIFRSNQFALAKSMDLIDALKRGTAIKAEVHYETWCGIMATLEPDMGMPWLTPYLEPRRGKRNSLAPASWKPSTSPSARFGLAC